MHEFEFQVRHLLTKYKLSKWQFEILFEYYEFALGNNIPYGEKIMEHVCEV